MDGTAELKDAIVKKFKRENNLTYTSSQITVGAGGKQVIYNAILATINPGEEVIIPAPYWVSYPDIVLLAGGVPRVIECDEATDFKITPSQIEENINDKTKCIILNSPSNPTGASYTSGELEKIADILRKYPKVLIMSDDIYEHVTYDNFVFSTIAQYPEMLSRTLTVN